MKLSISVDSDPSLIRVCDGCGISNYCSCETEVGESNPIPETLEEAVDVFVAETVRKAKGTVVHTVTAEVEIEGEVQSEDATVTEETAPSAAEPEIPEEAPVEETNVTVSKEEQIRAQIAELEAQLEKEE